MHREKARRKAVPLSIAIGSPTGQGKTYSALLMAAGLANGGKIGFVDTEHGRGSMYADDAGIIAAMPQGYDVVEITEPYTPEKYIEALRLFGDCEVVIIDSTSHEWEGSGGCMDIAENNKLGGLPNWAKAKMSHKRFMNVTTQSGMHLIFCLRAREKTKPGKDDKGKTIMVECGMQPICEKNFMFEMTLSMLLDTNYRPLITKCPRPLLHLFRETNSIITKETGEQLRVWAESGESIDKMLRQLKQECREAAMYGNASLDNFFKELSPERKKSLTQGTDKHFQVEVRELAREADASNEVEKEEAPAEIPAGGASLFGGETPAQVKTNEIISSIQAAKTEDDLIDFVTENQGHIAYMPDDLQERVLAEIENAKAKFR